MRLPPLSLPCRTAGGVTAAFTCWACAIRLWGSTPDAAKTLEPLWPQMSDQFVYLCARDLAFYSGDKELDQKSVAAIGGSGRRHASVSFADGKALPSHSDDEKALTEIQKSGAGPEFPFLHFQSGDGYEHLQDTKCRAEFRKG